MNRPLKNINISPNKKAWRKLKRNRLAFASLVFIGLMIVIAILGYVIVPDKTKFGNRQIVELKLKHPGFQIDILRIPLAKAARKSNLIQKIFVGSEAKDKWVPILDYRFEEDKLIAEKYVGDASKGFSELYQVGRLLFADFAEQSISGDQVTITLKSGESSGHSLSLLQDRIKEKHIFSNRFMLGTDAVGRDYLTRLVLGVRISLAVGLMAVIISLLIGILLGSMAGYFRGKVDDIIMYVINVFWSIPTLLLALSLALVLENGLWQVFLAIGLTMWIEVARIVRGQIMVIRELEYIEAARSMGFGHARIIIKHVLPNITGPLIVVIAGNFAGAILLEAGLSFLGLGVDRPLPSWGMMLSDNRTYLVAGLPHLAIIPGAAISLLVLAFFTLGNGLRDAFDVKSKINT